MFGSLGFTELIIVVLIFAGLVWVVSLFLRKSDSAEEPLLTQRPSFAMSEGDGETRTKGPDEKFCQECGSVIRVKAAICPQCGVRQASGSSSGRNRVVAALFR
jgi:hypothetical protein